MSDPILSSLLLFVAGVIGGTLNAIAGGGSLLMLPVLIFLGLPPTVANGTNRVGILVQNLAASGSFHRRGLIPMTWLRFALVPGLIGAGLGTWAAVQVGDLAFQRILAAVMVLTAAATFWRPSGEIIPDVEPPSGGARAWGYRVGIAALAVYAGFIQAGFGFLALAFTSMVGLDLIRGNAFKVTLVLCFTPVALAGFALSGQVDWVMGVTLAAGTFVGGLLGVHLQVLKGQKWIRTVVTVMIVLFAVRLLTTS